MKSEGTRRRKKRKVERGKRKEDREREKRIGKERRKSEERIGREALVVQWYDVSLPRMRPGFDSRQAHFLEEREKGDEKSSVGRWGSRQERRTEGRKEERRSEGEKSQKGGE